MFDLSINDLSRARYAEMLAEAELERKARRLRHQGGSRWLTQVLLHLSQWLIGSGHWLKAHVEMRPSLSQR